MTRSVTRVSASTSRLLDLPAVPATIRARHGPQGDIVEAVAHESRGPGSGDPLVEGDIETSSTPLPAIFGKRLLLLAQGTSAIMARGHPQAASSDLDRLTTGTIEVDDDVAGDES